MSGPDDGAPSGGGSGDRRGELSPAEREAIRKRAEEIGGRLDAARSRRVEPSEAKSRARGSALGQAFKISIELVAGVAVGGFIGWYLDGWLGTRPWLLVLFLVLGFAGGMMNTIRTAQRMQKAAEPQQRNAPSVRDDDDER